MRVRVKFFGDLYELIGTFKLELEVTNGLSIHGLIDLISHTFNPKFTEAVLDGNGKLRVSMWCWLMVRPLSGLMAWLQS